THLARSFLRCRRSAPADGPSREQQVADLFGGRDVRKRAWIGAPLRPPGALSLPDGTAPRDAGRDSPLVGDALAAPPGVVLRSPLGGAADVRAAGIHLCRRAGLREPQRECG